MKKPRRIRPTKEERAWEKWILSGKAKRIPDFARMKNMLMASARAKTKLVSIRIREHDLMRLRMRAAHEGIPYQTLINSLLHKYAQEEYSR